MPRAHDIDWERCGLGTADDDVIAERLAKKTGRPVAAKTVRLHRNRLGIAPHTPQGRPSEGKTKATLSRGVRLPRELWGRLETAATEDRRTVPELLGEYAEDGLARRAEQRSSRGHKKPLDDGGA